jgi:hypothetical protein
MMRRELAMDDVDPVAIVVVFGMYMSGRQDRDCDDRRDSENGAEALSRGPEH